MSACERYEADLSALLDGELHDPAREEELRAHMDVCEDCRMLYETFALLHEDAQEPPADLTARIMDAVRSEEADNVIPMPKKKNRWLPWLAAAACFVVIVGAVALPRLTADAPKNTAASVRSVPTPDQSGNDPVPEDAPELVAASDTAPLALTDQTQIADVRAMLDDPTDTEAPAEEAKPVLTLSEGEDETTIYLDGDDVLYTTDGSQYLRCAGAADTLVTYLEQLP